MGESAKEMGFLSHWPLILLLVVVLIILGPGKLPQIGGAIGGAIKEFRKSTSDIKDAISPVEQSPAAAAATQATPATAAEHSKDAPGAPKS
jgi:TatA/E family protein of Tat protein translocase